MHIKKARIIMMEKKFLRRLIAATLGIAMAAGMIIGTPALSARAADSTKVVYLSVAFKNVRWEPPEIRSEEENQKIVGQNRYSLNVAHKTRSKLTKNMSISNTVYVPVDALKADDSRFDLDYGVHVTSFDKKGNPVWGGFIEAKYKIVLENHYGYIVMWKEDASNDYKPSRVGGFATYKKVGKYYAVTIKNIPLKDFINVWDENKKTDVPKAINTKKTCLINTNVSFGSQGQKMSKKPIYLTDLTVNAKKTITTNFTKKDYEGVNGWSEAKQRDVRPKVGTIK